MFFMPTLLCFLSGLVMTLVSHGARFAFLRLILATSGLFLVFSSALVFGAFEAESILMLLMLFLAPDSVY